jgi:2-methylisocitrate lyase-like PEP mutase family enzyme
MYLTGPLAGDQFRRRIQEKRLLPLIGVYDVFSAQIAAKRFEGVFCSGYSYAASAYGLPDVGYVNWHDITDFATKIRHRLPRTHVLVDVDDGFGDEVVASNSGRCGHFEGKQILPVDEYLIKLSNVLKTRSSIFVIARTDAQDPEEGIERAIRYVEAGADGVMVEAIKDLKTISKLRSHIPNPIMVNQLHGGKSPNWRFDELEDAGTSIVIYSTPCLFAAQYGIERYLDHMLELHRLPSENTASMDDCAVVLNDQYLAPVTPIAWNRSNGPQSPASSAPRQQKAAS